jgi:FtsZ-binding cell division protein ZapB
MGQELEGAGERLRTMLREMERVCEDPQMQREQERLREMDRLQERLRALVGEMDQAGESLHHVAAGS